MKLHDAFFYFVSFFLIGVFIASFKINFFFIILGVFLFIAILLIFSFLKNKISLGAALAILSLVIIFGALYYNIYDKQILIASNIPFKEKSVFNGIVIEYPQRGDNQKLIINIQPPYSGKILANLKPYPSFNYGDLIQFEGIINKPKPQWYADYLAKDGILGAVNYPRADFISKNNSANWQIKVKTALFKFKNKITETFQKTLPYEKAAFLSGITLGERAEFSKDLKDKMSKSGTTHLVALSGQNITIIAVIVAAFFGSFLKRKFVFWPTLFIILLFVLMTGAEASVVRAAIMGGIIMLAKQIGRTHSMRNAIAAAALLMILYNPKILRFDLGFQLSFAALIGIVYLMPAIQKMSKFKEEPGFLGWRENFLTTTSAQLAVLPLLLINFNNFSFFSLPANILILEAIPLTMIFGFILGIFGFLSIYLAKILGLFTGLFLSYELWIIDIFSKFPQPNFKMGIFGAIVYYLIIIGFIFYEKIIYRDKSSERNKMAN
ncbi:ComEC/Rec2 family competence protein [Candidatus Wolfebacteria bacterium]|nr:ComEC/Rec2 family competence protein [Candidatus Wolfebacteria bacterium]